MTENHLLQALASSLLRVADDTPVSPSKYLQLDDILSELQYKLSTDTKLVTELPDELKIQLIECLCQILQPSVDVFPPDGEDDDEPTKNANHFHRLSSASLSILSLILADIELSHYPDIIQPLIIALATFSDPNTSWTKPASSTTAANIASQHPPLTSHSTLTSLLTTYIKPLFTSRPSTITPAGRAAIRPSTKKPYSFNETSSKPWQNTLYTPSILHFIVSHIPPQQIETNWHLVIPPLLTILDEGSIPSKSCALRSLTVLLSKSDDGVDMSLLLKRTGLMDVIWTAAFPCLAFLPPITAVVVSREVLDAAFGLLRVLAGLSSPSSSRSKTVSLLNNNNKPQPNGNKDGNDKETPLALRSHYLSKLLRDGILRKQTYTSDNAIIQTLYIFQISQIVEEMGVYSIRHLRSIMTFITNVLSAPFATAYLPLLREAAKALRGVVRVCWVRISGYAVVIVRGVVVAWLRIVEEGEGKSGSAEVMDGLKGCMRDLHVVMMKEEEGGGITDIATKVVGKDDKCRGLFEGIL